MATDVCIKDVTPGTQVLYCGVKAWVVGKSPVRSDLYLLGWKKGEPAGGMGWELGPEGAAIQALCKKYNCILGWNVDSDIKVTLLNSPKASSANSAGLTCRRCYQFFPMAVANRPDGVSLICYSCRQGWIPAGM